MGASDARKRSRARGRSALAARRLHARHGGASAGLASVAALAWPAFSWRRATALGAAIAGPFVVGWFIADPLFAALWGAVLALAALGPLVALPGALPETRQRFLLVAYAGVGVVRGCEIRTHAEVRLDTGDMRWFVAGLPFPVLWNRAPEPHRSRLLELAEGSAVLRSEWRECARLPGRPLKIGPDWRVGGYYYEARLWIDRDPRIARWADWPEDPEVLAYCRDRSEREASARRLASLRGREALPELVGALQAPDPHLRAAAASALAEVGATETIPAIETARKQAAAEAARDPFHWYEGVCVPALDAALERLRAAPTSAPCSSP